MCEEDKVKQEKAQTPNQNWLKKNVSLEYIHTETAPLRFQFKKCYIVPDQSCWNQMV